MNRDRTEEFVVAKPGGGVSDYMLALAPEH